MRVAAIGEFALIDRLAGLVGPSANPGLLMGIGDDAAVWDPEPGTLTVATTDCLVEGVHFDLRTTSWADLGWKALAENLSDIAAMGCRPRYALVGLAIPSDHVVADVEALYRGLAECGATYGCAIVGGDTVHAPIVVLNVTVAGESLPGAGHELLLLRSAAKPGDAVAVTGPLGGSAAGLRLLAQGPRRGAEESRLAEVHLRPKPRITAGLALVEAGVRCAIDVSDGLLADLGHVCERSDVDAEIYVPRVPVHPDVLARFGQEAPSLALTGGEDYELIAVGSPAALERASQLLADRGEPPLVTVGDVLARQAARPAVRVRGAGGQLVNFERAGYQHFAASR